MPTVVAVEENRLSLVELLDSLAPGQEVVLTRDSVAVAKLVRSGGGLRPPPGLGKGLISVVAEDDDHLAAFRDYVP